MKVFIIRHANSVGNELKVIDSSDAKFDLGLSEKGKKQAEELVQTLSKQRFDAFVISPLKRTIETLNPYLKTLQNPKVIVNPLTLERNAGEFIGKELEAMKEYCKVNSISDRVSFKPKGGESILDVYERAKKFLEFLKTNFKDESILICGHKNFLTCLEILVNSGKINEFYSVKALENGEMREFEI